ncbi:unnamed protein product, partial [Protopolystoma xenopodis]
MTGSATRASLSNNQNPTSRSSVVPFHHPLARLPALVHYSNSTRYRPSLKRPPSSGLPTASPPASAVVITTRVMGRFAHALVHVVSARLSRVSPEPNLATANGAVCSKPRVPKMRDSDPATIGRLHRVFFRRQSGGGSRRKFVRRPTQTVGEIRVCRPVRWSRCAPQRREVLGRKLWIESHLDSTFIISINKIVQRRTGCGEDGLPKEGEHRFSARLSTPDGPGVRIRPDPDWLGRESDACRGGGKVISGPRAAAKLDLIVLPTIEFVFRGRVKEETATQAVGRCVQGGVKSEDWLGSLAFRCLRNGQSCGDVGLRRDDVGQQSWRPETALAIRSSSRTRFPAVSPAVQSLHVEGLEPGTSTGAHSMLLTAPMLPLLHISEPRPALLPHGDGLARLPRPSGRLALGRRPRRRPRPPPLRPDTVSRHAGRPRLVAPLRRAPTPAIDDGDGDGDG